MDADVEDDFDREINYKVSLSPLSTKNKIKCSLSLHLYGIDMETLFIVWYYVRDCVLSQEGGNLCNVEVIGPLGQVQILP